MSRIKKILQIICNKVIHVFDKIISPFKVIPKEPIFLLWVIGSAFLAPLIFWIAFFNADMEKWKAALETLSNTTTGTLCLSIITPMVFDVLFDIKIKQRQEKICSFLNYRITTSSISFLFAIYVCILMNNKRTNLYLNLAIVLFAILFTFYMYCINRMELFNSLSQYESETYIEEEEKRLSELENKSKKSKGQITIRGRKVKV